jgi:hypothetical protein
MSLKNMKREFENIEVNLFLSISIHFCLLGTYIHVQLSK